MLKQNNVSPASDVNENEFSNKPPNAPNSYVLSTNGNFDYEIDDSHGFNTVFYEWFGYH